MFPFFYVDVWLIFSGLRCIITDKGRRSVCSYNCNLQEIVIKSKIIYCLNFLWTSFVAFTFPICFGWIFLDITGHSKGYSYDLGSEKDVSIMLGCIELLIWLALALPSNIYVFRKTMGKGKAYLLIPIILYIALAVICVMLTHGGWTSYANEVFNI